MNSDVLLCVYVIVKVLELPNGEDTEQMYSKHLSV